jgi:Family of unknown function (DUF5714)
MTNTANQRVTACRFCGAPIEALDEPTGARCMICGKRGLTRACCSAGHFVCEECRGGELMQILEAMLDMRRATDPVETFVKARIGLRFPMHGPRHHALVAAAFLLAYHDLYGEPSWATILETLQSADTQLPGGTCGYWGACSAALAVGMAYCAILGASPTDGPPRAAAQQLVGRIVTRVGEFDGPRCCRRECLLALQVGCELSATHLPKLLPTVYQVHCEQASKNPECIDEACPYA